MMIFIQASRIVVFEKEKWLEKAEDLHFENRSVEAERGNILAEDGSLLATSLPYYDLHFDPLTVSEDDFNKHVDSLSYCLAYFVDPSYTPGGYKVKLVEARQLGNRYLLIKKNATHLDVEKIRKFPLFNKGRYKGGLIIDKKQERKRPFGILAHRTIGYIREGAHPVGLEGRFDEVLKGDAGERLMRKIRGLNGQTIWIPADDYTKTLPESGKDVMTTIDINLQDIVEQALLRGLKKHDAQFGTAVMMEVKTGAIKAIANIGKTEESWWERYNYAVGQSIEPGSTFKLASVMALLEDGLADLEDTISLENGTYEFYEETMVDASAHGLEESTLRKAFEISSNVGIAKLINEKYTERKEKYIKRLKSFNLDLPTGIEIDGEVAPYIKDPNNEEDNWSGTTLPWMSIGYELTMTPLQLLTFYNAVANDGKMMKPYLVSEIQKYGETIKQFKPTVIDKSIASSSTIKKAKQLLEGVVLNGTAKKLQSSIYDFAGKTGTAQVNYSKANTQGMKHQASFAGYFPADNPQYTVIVVINAPKQGGFYGGDVAGPIFREIADKTYTSKLQIQTAINIKDKPNWRTYKLPNFDLGDKNEMTLLLNELNIPYVNNTITDNQWAIIKAESDTLSVLNRTINENIVPNVLGMGLKDAIYILENNGLKVTVSGLGKVRSQSIPPGRKIKGQTIHLKLS